MFPVMTAPIPRHAQSEFQLWYSTLSAKERKKFAKSAGTSVDSIKVNYIRPLVKPLASHYRYKRPCRCQPSSKTMMVLAKATGNACSYKDMRDHFYPL